MVIISGKLFGFISLGTVHFSVGIDLPVRNYRFNLGLIQVSISLGPLVTKAPDHSVEVSTTTDPVYHDPMDPQLPPDLGIWN